MDVLLYYGVKGKGGDRGEVDVLHSRVFTCLVEAYREENEFCWTEAFDTQGWKWKIHCDNVAYAHTLSKTDVIKGIY